MSKFVWFDFAYLKSCWPEVERRKPHSAAPQRERRTYLLDTVHEGRFVVVACSRSEARTKFMAKIGGRIPTGSKMRRDCEPNEPQPAVARKVKRSGTWQPLVGSKPWQHDPRVRRAYAGGHTG